MASSGSWILIPPSVPPSGPSVSVSGIGIATVPTAERAYLGHCITRPLRRDQKYDFANESGVALVSAAVGQILGTICENGAAHGELPWDTEFGSALILLHHKNPDEVFAHLARVYVEEALRRWEPRAITKDVQMITETIDGESHVVLKIKFDIAANNTPGSSIIAKDLMASTFLS